MSDKPPQFYDTRVEHCPECDSRCEHHVRVEIIKESEEYGSRQPHRRAECQKCGNVKDDRVGF